MTQKIYKAVFRKMGGDVFVRAGTFQSLLDCAESWGYRLTAREGFTLEMSEIEDRKEAFKRQQTNTQQEAL